MQRPDAMLAANWVSGELFGIMHANGAELTALPISPAALAGLLDLLQEGKINNATAKTVLAKMVSSGREALAIIEEEGLSQVSDREAIAEVVRQVLTDHPDEVQAYREGKTALRQWFFGQVMRRMSGQANPGLVQELLKKYL
jgi:aspartyl-tRNA(Asn)/glutamyl-tRNA(Gln) amidotransferase subunit B